ARARGRVWEQGSRPPAEVTSWRLADGRYRVLGPEESDVPDTVDRAPVEPSLEDAYLLLTGSVAR
ncbi:MAG TPA: ABC transporter ATP-binding protein, partial [Nocardiopsis listeri]|nr:ABC transporter ATP-binding protein [Nocardiopsis listeri]